MPASEPGSDAIPTGIKGLDAILSGGLPSGEIYVLQGGSGTGKTTVGLEFLMAGAAGGEKVLFITFAQTEAALRKIAASHGWSLDGRRSQGADRHRRRP